MDPAFGRYLSKNLAGVMVPVNLDIGTLEAVFVNEEDPHVNPLGVKLGQCTYCGFCERFGCGNYSKASPQTCVLPALLRFPNFSAQTESEVTKINLDSTGKRATRLSDIYGSTRRIRPEMRARVRGICSNSSRATESRRSWSAP